MAPFEYANAVLVWNLVSLAAVAWSGWLILRGLNVPLTGWSAFPIMAIALQCSPLQQQVIYGQLNGVLLLLFTGVWWADRTKRPAWAGVGIGVAAAIKLFPAFLLLHFALQRQWRTVVSGVLSLLAVTAATALLFGVDCFQTFLHKILPYTAAFRSRRTNSSLIGWSTKLFNPATLQEQVEPWIRSPWLEIVVSALLCGAVLVLWMPTAWRASHRESQDRAFGLSLTAMLLVSPITWDHYFLLLLLPIVLTWKGLSESMAERWCFVAVVFMLCVSPSVLWKAFGRDDLHGVVGPVETLTVLSVHLYAMLVLFWLQARRTTLGRKTTLGSESIQEAS